MKHTSKRSWKQENNDARISHAGFTLEKDLPQSRIGILQHLCVQACEGQDAEGIGSCTHSDQSQIASPEIFGVDLRFQQHLARTATFQAPSKLDTKDPPAWSERMRGSSSMQLCGWQKKKFEAWPCSNSNFLGQLCSTFIQVSTLLPRTTHQNANAVTVS